MSIKNNTKLYAFTLIELMMVVAILGILASIAMPSYRDYTIRAKVGDMISAAAALKITAAEYRMAQGEFTKDENTQQILDRLGGNDPKDISPYIESLSLATPAENKIEVGLCGNAKELGLPAGETLHIYLVGEFINPGVDWTCHYGESNANGARYVPPVCRNSYQPAPAQPACGTGSGTVNP